MGESEWFKEYLLLGFNFGLNHLCVKRDNINKIGSGVSIGSVHRFIGFQNQKLVTEQN